jgi:hypothetical protein
VSNGTADAIELRYAIGDALADVTTLPESRYRPNQNRVTKARGLQCLPTQTGEGSKVKNLEDYAGLPGHAIIGFAARVSEGSLWYLR